MAVSRMRKTYCARLRLKPDQPLLVVCMVATLCSCATDKRPVHEEAAALTTVSAMVVALPLIPVVNLHHALSGSSSKWKEQAEERRRVFDPIYEKRIAMISERDPVADARDCWQRGEMAFLPSLPKGGLYPGLEKTKLAPQEREQNLAVIERSELLTYLLRLMDRDPEQTTGAGVNYTSPIWKAFVKAGWAYKTKFNLEIYRRSREKT